MRNLVWCLIGLAFLSGGCLKEDNRCSPNNSVAPDSEVQALQEYINSHGIAATKHGSGLFYSVVSEGQGSTPNVCSTIKVDFAGILANGNPAEGDNDILVNLKVAVPGWQIGLPLIKAGGRIKLFLPPSLAYGSGGKMDGNKVVVPPGSIVIYDISLILVE